MPVERPFASKSLMGFATSPNPEVQDLEDVLGIRFSNPPARIDLTRRNRLVFIAKEHQPAHIVEGTRNAFYIRQYNAFFSRVGMKGRHVGWHENMHGYIDSVSQVEFPGPHHALDLLNDRLHGEEIDPMEMERIASGAAFAEGLAEWAAIKTAREIGTPEEASKADENHSTYIELEDGNIVHGARNFLEEQTFKATEIIINPVKETAIRDMSSVLRELVKSLYFVGYSFMTEAMDALKARGFSVASAIDYLIANPPKTLRQIEYPKRHVETVLKK